MDSKKIFDETKSLEDWISYSSSTKDGENAYCENKEVGIDLNETNPSTVGDFKLRTAKEMSAFANTDSGVIALGVDSELEVKNNTLNLEDWLDKNIKDMLEPQLSGIALKTCTDADGKEFVLMYIPKGNVIPYRVGTVKSCEKEKKNLREYFQRIGTNSVPIPVPIVRSLYLSNERATDILAYVKPTAVHTGDSDERPYIELGIVIKPDQTRLINEYYLEANVLLLNKDLKPLHDTSIDIVPFGPNSPQRPVIPPDNKHHTIDTFRLQQAGHDYGIYAPSVMDFGTEEITVASYSQIGGLFVETRFACDGLPLKEDKRLLIFDSTIKNSEIDSRAHEMAGWSKDCLVVSWYSITDENGYYYKIVGFMNEMGFKID